VKTNISFYALEYDGKQHSKMDDGQAGGITTEKAAKKIVNAIYKQKQEVLVGSKELLMVYIKRFLPNLSRKLVRRIKPT
jgi:short-subunit dehydrogenase